jgi:phosphoribosylformylglycinamidine synthase
VTGKPPVLDLELERKVQSVCLAAVRQGLAASAHDCSDGGLAVTLAESCLQGKRGAQVTLPESAVRLDAQLFGESPSRIVISARPEHAARIQELAAQAGAPVSVLGTVGGKTLRITANGTRQVSLPVEDRADLAGGRRCRRCCGVTRWSQRFLRKQIG